MAAFNSHGDRSGKLSTSTSRESVEVGIGLVLSSLSRSVAPPTRPRIETSPNRVTNQGSSV